MYAILYKPNSYPDFRNWKLAFTSKSLDTAHFKKRIKQLEVSGHKEIKILKEINNGER